MNRLSIFINFYHFTSANLIDAFCLANSNFSFVFMGYFFWPLQHHSHHEQCSHAFFVPLFFFRLNDSFKVNCRPSFVVFPILLFPIFSFSIDFWTSSFSASSLFILFVPAQPLSKSRIYFLSRRSIFLCGTVFLEHRRWSSFSVVTHLRNCNSIRRRLSEPFTMMLADLETLLFFWLPNTIFAAKHTYFFLSLFLSQTFSHTCTLLH